MRVLIIAIALLVQVSAASWHIIQSNGTCEALPSHMTITKIKQLNNCIDKSTSGMKKAGLLVRLDCSAVGLPIVLLAKTEEVCKSTLRAFAAVPNMK